jgi:hypothetical protein
VISGECAKQFYDRNLQVQQSKAEQCMEDMNVVAAAAYFATAQITAVKVFVKLEPRHSAKHIQHKDTQHNDIQHNVIQHNDIQHNDK